MADIYNTLKKLETSNEELKSVVNSVDERCISLLDQQNFIINCLENRCADLEQKLSNLEAKNKNPEPPTIEPQRSWLFLILSYIAIPFLMVLFMILEPLKGL